MNEINISNKTSFNIRHKVLIQKVFDYILKKHDFKIDSHVNLIIVEPEKMGKLYLQYKNTEKETDVLSFSADYEELSSIIGYNELGDIYINYDKVITQANEYGHSIERELIYLFVHGLLHILGHDHINKKDETLMNAMASSAMKEIGVNR